MRLTIEENRDALRRYAHLTAPRGWGATRCSAPCPGTARACTRARGHSGPHVAHGRFRGVVAAWDSGAPGTAVGPSSPRQVAGAGIPGGRGGAVLGSPGGGGLRRLRALRDLATSFVTNVEELVYLLFFLAFVGFAVHWFVLAFLG